MSYLSDFEDPNFQPPEWDYDLEEELHKIAAAATLHETIICYGAIAVESREEEDTRKIAAQQQLETAPSLTLLQQQPLTVMKREQKRKNKRCSNDNVSSIYFRCFCSLVPPVHCTLPRQQPRHLQHQPKS